MALQFWLGGQRSDKSNKLLKYVCNEAKNNPNTDYLVVVPEQFGLATQKEYVLASDNKGILNIDVLSFMRLAHRINDEVGSYDSTVTTLDDMGKNLLLQLLASENKDELTAFSDNIDRLGTITKLKSMISEFMQYGITPDRVDEMINTANIKNRSLLAAKLSDVNFLYRKFLEYKQDKYTTTEETLSRVSSIIHKSNTIKNSVIIFDGFTGFTPVQNRLIATLLEYAKDIHVALLYEEGSDLFALSKHTINSLEKMASDRQVVVRNPYIGKDIYDEPEKGIIVGATPDEEIRLVACKIRRLVKEKGLRYRDIAIVTGDLEGYRNVCYKALSRNDIPFFYDKTQPMLLNPFVEYIRSLLSIFADNYSYEAMFRFLKSGLTTYTREDIDLLDNYCVAAGVKGYKKWHERFTFIPNSHTPEQVVKAENIRESVICNIDKFVEELKLPDNSVFNAARKCSVYDYTVALYKVIELEGIEDKLKDMSDRFKEVGDSYSASEYSQVYIKIMKSLEEIVELISDEMVDIRTYTELINAGLDSIRIGIPPKGADCVLVGDLTRSRLEDIKVLFIVGANEGVIPAKSNGSGVINESDREFLTENVEKLVIAPTIREDTFTQRLYLYMALNKPTEKVFLSYSRMGNDGKAAMPSYIIRKIRNENNGITIEELSDNSNKRLDSMENAFSEMLTLVTKVINGEASEEERSLAKELIKLFLGDDNYSDRTKNVLINVLTNIEVSDDNSIGKAIANILYGKKITSNITRLESYANCAYQYFLKYGLSLKERERFSFEARNLGNIFHDSLSEYSRLIEKNGYDWSSIPEGKELKLMDEAVETTVAKLHEASLYSSARTAYMVNRIKRIMGRTAEVITGQVKNGEYVPKYFEIDFEQMDSINSLKFKLSEDEEMKLRGRVDRIDVCENDDRVYVKIIDYKSSGKSIDLAAIYEGRQLQLLVYLNAALEHETNRMRMAGKTDIEVIPAGVLYYHIEDPVIAGDGDDSNEHIRDRIMEELKLTGLLNGDDNGEAINLMDKNLEEGGKSVVVKASRKKDGELGSSKDIVAGEDINTLQKYINEKITDIGKRIVDGDISVPIPDGVDRITKPNCEYCDYKSICINRMQESEAGVIAEVDPMEMIRNKVKG